MRRCESSVSLLLAEDLNNDPVSKTPEGRHLHRRGHSEDIASDLFMDSTVTLFEHWCMLLNQFQFLAEWC